MSIAAFVSPACTQENSGRPEALGGSSFHASKGAEESYEPTGEGSAEATSTTGSLSPGLREILNMSEAGVAPKIIQSFIRRSPIAYSLTARDIIALKEHGVSDDVTTAMLNRGTALRRQAERARADLAAPIIARNLRGEGGLDPESYDFWYYHYAYPRTVSSSFRQSTLQGIGYSYVPPQFRHRYRRR